jgi:hypothetical protein
LSPGPLPSENYKSEIGFDPMDKSLSEFLPVIYDERQVSDNVNWGDSFFKGFYIG